MTGDELYVMACKRWAANWLTSKEIGFTSVDQVRFEIEEGYCYSSCTYGNGTYEIIIEYTSDEHQMAHHIDMTDAPAFGDLVQQICKAYDEVKAP